MSVLAPPPSPSPSSCFDAMLSDTDINIDRAMPPTSLKRKASSTKSRAAASIHSSSSDAENRPLIQSSSASTIAKPKRAAKVEVADMAPSKSASTSSPGPAAKKAKLTSSAALVELKNGKLVLKQKPFNWASTMPVLKAVITFQEYLDVHEKLDSIPQDHLHVIAKLAQESDKSLVELAKAIRSKILPEADLGSSESDDSATSGAGAKAKLPLSCIQAAISAVAERRNYGIDAAIAAPHASGSDAADAVAVPAPLQLWRWEATDSAMLPSEFLEKLTQRQNERESARTQAEQLFSSLTEQERQALLSKSTKAKISATITADAQGHIPAGSSASQPIAIDDDNDDGSVADTEHDRKAAQAPSTPVASRKRKSPSSTSTPQSAAKSSAMAGDTSASATSSPREKKKAKEAVELSPEKQKEKEEKDAAKAERLKAKEAKRLEREAKELGKQKAKEAKEAEQKKAEELKQRQVNFFTSFVKKAAPKSPSKSVVAAAASSSASGKPAEDVSDFDRTFLPCQYKDLAPINRFASRSGSKPELEMGQDDLSRDEMLSQFLTRASALSGNAGTRARRRKGVHPPASVREIKRVVTESDVLGGNAQEQAEKALETLQDRSKVQMKLLQFESDRRPGWYGTWTKSTNLISPRCPLGQDPVSLDYSYDSDADWEELGQVEGEDVQDGEEEKEDSVGDSDEDSEMDDWLVDDLEVEEEEEQARSAANAMDVDDEIVEVDKLGMPVPAQPVTTNLLHPKKKKKVKLLGRRFDAKLVPFSTGPHWEREFGRCDYDLFSSYRIELLNDACFGLNPFTFTSAEPVSSTAEPDEASIVDTPTKPRRGLPAGGVLAALWGDVAAASDAPPAPAASTADKPEAAAPTAFKHQLRPDAIAPLLARIHGSTKTRAGLVDDLKEMLDQLAMPASKNAIGERLTAYATKEKKPNAPWVVKPAFAHLLPS